MPKLTKTKRLRDSYRFPGFHPALIISGMFGDPRARVIRLTRIQDVAKEHLLDWRAVKTLEMQYMREQIKRAGQPRPGVIGIDEISIRKGHIYRIVVSDLERRRAIWFGGKDRSEESMDMFFAFLGERRSKRIRLAVMDMWKPFLKST